MVTGNRGASVVDLRERRIERLRRDLTERLAAGHVVMEASEVDSLDEWRTAARAASRRAGWRVRTGTTVGETHVWAARVDVDPPSDGGVQLMHALDSMGKMLAPHPGHSADGTVVAFIGRNDG